MWSQILRHIQILIPKAQGWMVCTGTSCIVTPIFGRNYGDIIGERKAKLFWTKMSVMAGHFGSRPDTRINMMFLIRDNRQLCRWGRWPKWGLSTSSQMPRGNGVQLSEKNLTCKWGRRLGHLERSVPLHIPKGHTKQPAWTNIEFESLRAQA